MGQCDDTKGRDTMKMRRGKEIALRWICLEEIVWLRIDNWRDRGGRERERIYRK